MCVIIHKPKNADIAQETFEKCWKENPHGSGMMYVSDGKLIVVKGMMTLNAFMDKYAEYKCVEKEVVIHFRLASAGTVTPDQTHPFWVFSDQLAVVHNGHIMGYDTGGLKQSDTMIFNQEILTKLPKDFLSNDAILELLDNYIAGSVMVFMDKLGNIKMVGTTAGSIFLNGCWFSNDFWQDESSSSTLSDGNFEELLEEAKFEAIEYERRDIDMGEED